MLKELADTIGKAMGNSGELSNVFLDLRYYPEHNSDRAESLYLSAEPADRSGKERSASISAHRVMYLANQPSSSHPLHFRL